MVDIYEEEDTQGIIQVDANNAFNTINRKILLYNINIICPEIAIFTTNCYSVPARLFVVGGVEILSCEGTTQGDPIAMPIYALGVLPLLSIVWVNGIKQEAFADDLTGAGKIKDLKIWWDNIIAHGPFLGYTAKPSKSWLIVKHQHLQYAHQVFSNSGLNIPQKDEDI